MSSNPTGRPRARRAAGAARGGERALAGRIEHGAVTADLPHHGLAADGARRPAADHRREEPGTATAVHQQQAAGPELRQGRIRDVLGQTLGDAARAAHHLAARDLEQLAEPAQQVRLAPARLAEDARVLGPDREQAVEREHELRVMERAQVDREGARERLGIARELVDDAARALAGEGGHGVGPGAAPKSHASGGHGEPSSSSAKQKPILPGLPCVARSTSPGRPPPTLRTTSWSARPIVAFARLPCPNTFLPEFMPIRRRIGPFTISDRPDRHRRREHAVDVELVGADRLDRGEHHRQILGQAARHHRVDRHLLDRGRREIGRHHRDHLVGRARRAGEHREHAALGRRHHRQPVGPAAREQRLRLVFERRERDAARREIVCLEAHRQIGRDVRIDAQRAAAGPPLGEARAEPGDSRELLPVAAMPADRALHLDAILDANQCRDRLDPVVVGHREARCRLPASRPSGKPRSSCVYTVSGVRAASSPQARGDQLAGRALALHDGDQAGRQGGNESDADRAHNSPGLEPTSTSSFSTRCRDIPCGWSPALPSALSSVARGREGNRCAHLNPTTGREDTFWLTP